MKNFRIVSDSYSGYEAQVKYSLFPFVWFQLSAYKGVNSWNTCEQALSFVKQKKEGSYVYTGENLATIELEVKQTLSLGKIFKHHETVWQDLQTVNAQPAYLHAAY